MNIRKCILLRELESIPGVFQCTLKLNLDSLSVADFVRENIVLPFSLIDAVNKRQIEFLSSRFCAKICLENLGKLDDLNIPIAQDRSPIWPAGYCGSISHTDGWASAVVGKTTLLEGIGLDIEHKIKDAAPHLINEICCNDSELLHLVSRMGIDHETALTMIFSAKESLYKAVFPRLNSFFGFHAAHLEAIDSERLSIGLVTDLSEKFTKSSSWQVIYKFYEPDLIETMVLDRKPAV